MAVYNVPNYKTADGFGMSLNIRRGNPNPLDNSSVWSSYADALNYAQTSAISYVGQLVAVVTAPAEGEKAHKVDVYKIELDAEGIGTLVKVGAEEAEAEVEALKTQVSKLAADLEAANEDITTLNGKVVSLEEALGTAQNDIAAAREIADANAEAIEAIEADVEQAKTDITAVTTTANKNKTDIASLLAEKDNFATKTEVETAKTEAVAEAKTETENQISAVVSQYLTGDGAADTIDTLNEIAQWIADDEAGAAKVIADVKAIQDDYLKGSDKTELNQVITDLATFVGALPEDATSETVVDYIQEAINALNMADYAKASDLSILSQKVTDVEDVLADTSSDVEALSTALDSTNAKVLALETKEITVEDVTGLPDVLEGKVDTQVDAEGLPYRLISPTEAAKLDKLSFDEDGNVTTGQQVAAGDVIGLAEWITNNAATYAKNLSEANLTDALVTKIETAIKEVAVNGTTIVPVDGKVDLPLATGTDYGVIKLGTEFKNNEDGAVEITSVNVNKLTQTAGEYLELNGGTASGFEE